MGELFCNDSILREISPNFPIFLCSLNDRPWKKLKRKHVENAMIMLLKCHLQKNSADKILEVLIICTSKLWSKKENEKIGDDWNDFISYTEKAHSEIASQAKYNIKEYVMNSNFDAERMEVLKSWFPFLYEDGLTEGKTEARAQTQQGIIQLLQARFGELPQDIESNLKKMEDDSRLSKLIVVAGMATSLEDVAKAIKQN